MDTFEIHLCEFIVSLVCHFLVLEHISEDLQLICSAHLNQINVVKSN